MNQTKPKKQDPHVKLNPKWHNKLKVAAAQQGSTMKELLEEILEDVFGG